MCEKGQSPLLSMSPQTTGKDLSQRHLVKFEEVNWGMKGAKLQLVFSALSQPFCQRGEADSGNYGILLMYLLKCCHVDYISNAHV